MGLRGETLHWAIYSWFKAFGSPPSGKALRLLVKQSIHALAILAVNLAYVIKCFGSPPGGEPLDC